MQKQVKWLLLWIISGRSPLKSEVKLIIIIKIIIIIFFIYKFSLFFRITLYTAFSRDFDAKVYVQHLVIKYGKELAQLIENNF